MNGVSCRLQQLGNNGGGSGLSVAAGDADDGTGADLEKNLHLGGEHTSTFYRIQKLGQVRPHAGGAEDHIVPVQGVQIAFSQAETGPLPRKGLHLAIGRLPLVTGSNGDPGVQKQLDQGDIGNAEAQHSHLFSLERIEIISHGEAHMHFLLTENIGKTIISGIQGYYSRFYPEFQ